MTADNHQSRPFNPARNDAAVTLVADEIRDRYEAFDNGSTPYSPAYRDFVVAAARIMKVDLDESRIETISEMLETADEEDAFADHDDDAEAGMAEMIVEQIQGISTTSELDELAARYQAAPAYLRVELLDRIRAIDPEAAAELAPACDLCGEPVTAKDPVRYPYCKHCHYSGAAATSIRAEQTAAFAAAFPDATVHIDHTGGGCFWLSIRWPDDPKYVVLTDGNAGLPENEDGEPIRGGWGYIGRQDDTDDESNLDYEGTPFWYCGDAALGTGVGMLSDEEAIDRIRDLRGIRPGARVRFREGTTPYEKNADVVYIVELSPSGAELSSDARFDKPYVWLVDERDVDLPRSRQRGRTGYAEDLTLAPTDDEIRRDPNHDGDADAAGRLYWISRVDGRGRVSEIEEGFDASSRSSVYAVRDELARKNPRSTYRVRCI